MPCLHDQYSKITIPSFMVLSLKHQIGINKTGNEIKVKENKWKLTYFKLALKWNKPYWKLLRLIICISNKINKHVLSKWTFSTYHVNVHRQICALRKMSAVIWFWRKVKKWFPFSTERKKAFFLSPSWAFWHQNFHVKLFSCGNIMALKYWTEKVKKIHIKDNVAL